MMFFSLIALPIHLSKFAAHNNFLFINFITLMYKHSLSEVRKQRTHTVKSHNMTIDTRHTALPQINRHRTITDRNKNFNKYYISPTLRYKQKIENPQEDPQNFEDETYIYRNLHNQQYWNWVHPLADYRLQPSSDDIQKKVSIAALEKFRHYMEQRTHKRVPNIVKQLLTRHSDA